MIVYCVLNKKLITLYSIGVELFTRLAQVVSPEQLFFIGLHKKRWSYPEIR